jgi:hypothetical protein
VRTRAARAGIVMAGLAAVVALFFLFASGDDGGTDPATQAEGAQSATRSQSAQSTTRSQSAKSTEGATRGRSPKPQTPTIARIVVRGGNPVGGVKRLEYESGEQVRFSVASDVADEVHVHGFDIEKSVPVRGTARFRFAADIEGVFEIELHHSEVKIGELRIKP